MAKKYATKIRNSETLTLDVPHAYRTSCSESENRLNARNLKAKWTVAALTKGMKTNMK